MYLFWHILYFLLFPKNKFSSNPWQHAPVLCSWVWRALKLHRHRHQLAIPRVVNVARQQLDRSGNPTRVPYDCNHFVCRPVQLHQVNQGFFHPHCLLLFGFAPIFFPERVFVRRQQAEIDGREPFHQFSPRRALVARIEASCFPQPFQRGCRPEHARVVEREHVCRRFQRPRHWRYNQPINLQPVRLCVRQIFCQPCSLQMPLVCVCVSECVRACVCVWRHRRLRAVVSIQVNSRMVTLRGQLNGEGWRHRRLRAVISIQLNSRMVTLRRQLNGGRGGGYPAVSAHSEVSLFFYKNIRYKN